MYALSCNLLVAAGAAAAAAASFDAEVTDRRNRPFAFPILERSVQLHK